MAGTQEGAQVQDGVTLGMLIALRQQAQSLVQSLDGLIQAHTPREQQQGGGRKPPPTIGQRPSNGG